MSLMNFLPWRQQRRARCLRFWGAMCVGTVLLMFAVIFCLRINPVMRLHALQTELTGMQTVQHALASRQKLASQAQKPAQTRQQRAWQPVLESLSLREIRALIATKRHVKLSAQVIAAQAVVTMTVEIEEQQSAAERILALIKLRAEPIVDVRVVVLRRKQLTRLFHILIGTQFDDVIEADKVAVDIREDITRKIGVQEHRSCTHEGLDKTLAFWQVLFNIIEQGVFPPCPFQKSAIFFHAD